MRTSDNKNFCRSLEVCLNQVRLYTYICIDTACIQYVYARMCDACTYVLMM